MFHDSNRMALQQTGHLGANNPFGQQKNQQQNQQQQNNEQPFFTI